MELAELMDFLELAKLVELAELVELPKLAELMELAAILGCSAMLDIDVIGAVAGRDRWIFVGRCTGSIPLDEVSLLLLRVRC